MDGRDKPDHDNEIDAIDAGGLEQTQNEWAALAGGPPWCQPNKS
jgi:hypothetical protein